MVQYSHFDLNKQILNIIKPDHNHPSRTAVSWKGGEARKPEVLLLARARLFQSVNTTKSKFSHLLGGEHVY